MKHHLPCVDRDSDGEWMEVREITANIIFFIIYDVIFT